MDRMNLREAARRTKRSVTTLRRYIKSHRLRAEKAPGRYGPEYVVTEKDLLDADIPVEPDAPPRPVHTRSLARTEPATPAVQIPETVQLALYQELQLKHEQLLVQYGMVRASGLRVMELQTKLEESRRLIDDYSREISRLKNRLDAESKRARKERQEAELELHGRSLEIAALEEKVRGLEMLMRNAVTNETLEQQFTALMDQAGRVNLKSVPEKDH